jgi:hypothetical protein
MKMKNIVSIILILNSVSIFGQFRQNNIETDSSNIEIIRNSVYHIYKETYKNKDSIWYSVHFINDTARLNIEGWKTKENKYLGVWQEYNFDGELMYTRDHDNATCLINKALYPYYDFLEQIKSKADGLIISAYSKEFFDNHVRFNFNCNAYDELGYVGSWIEPIIRKPTKFLLRYSVKIGDTDWYPDMIEIELDSIGNYIPKYGLWNNYGFENVTSQKRTFQIDKLKAMEIAKQYGLKTTDQNKVSEFLRWENFRKEEDSNGHFRYYITELTKEIKDIKENGRSSVVYKFNVYSFNPWTGEFVEMKRMKDIYSWEELSGNWTGLILDDD